MSILHGRSQDFSKGESHRGYSPDCHLNIVGCLLTKSLTKRGGRGGGGHGHPRTPLTTSLLFCPYSVGSWSVLLLITLGHLHECLAIANAKGRAAPIFLPIPSWAEVVLSLFAKFSEKARLTAVYLTSHSTLLQLPLADTADICDVTQPSQKTHSVDKGRKR